MTSISSAAKQRAPAVYFAGNPPARQAAPYVFRLPCPPDYIVVRQAGRALKRRAKKAYFAALDAMRTGRVDSEAAAKLRRLLAEATTRPARALLGQLVNVMEAAMRTGEPILPPPPVPLGSLVATATDPYVNVKAKDDPLEQLAWPLEWLRTRGYIVTKGLQLRWEMPHGPMAAPKAPSWSALLESVAAE
jgi:hypothetical protein